MTTPAQNTNSDAPVADVPIGISEITSLIVLVGAILTAFFGKDWGIAANAQQYAGVAVVLLPIGLGLARAIKHHGAMKANAMVYLGQLTAVADALSSSSKAHTPAALAAGVSTLTASAPDPAPIPGDTPVGDTGAVDALVVVTCVVAFLVVMIFLKVFSIIH